MKANISEVFSSAQGEGPYVGLRQVFIRFTGCNLSCRYCDTGHDKSSDTCRVEIEPGRKRFIEIPNPVSVVELVKIITGHYPVSLHHSVSITGGEPLLHAEYLKYLLPELKKTGLKTYLETNGSLPGELARVIDLVDIVSMDIKLPGTSGCQPMWEDHRQFLCVARKAGVFVKIVMDDQSDAVEYSRALEMLHREDAGITLVIQPLTSNGKCALSPERALFFQAMALERLKDVRLIPQTHIFMGQM
ncbi:MAG: 7-carboxy-7-deazaguanine synthase QueE [Bacillota bacterium]